MSRLRKALGQVKPVLEQRSIDYVDRVQNLLRELTISPFYQQKGTFNPYYVLDDNLVSTITELLPEKEYDEILFRSVESGSGKLLHDAKGKFQFQIVLKRNNAEIDLPYYIKVSKKLVKSHYGMKTRKSATASSDVNEYLSMYFLAHPKFTDAETFMNDVSKLSGGTGVYTGEDEEVSYEKLIELLDKDETAIRDINIGYQNSLAIKKEVPKWDRLYWTPKKKPAGIGEKNPSDTIIHIGDGNYIGFSNKISAGKDRTPKINTNINAFFQKMGGNREHRDALKMIDDAWNQSASEIPAKAKNAVRALQKFDISREKPSESSSKAKIALLAKEFKKDRLDFYSKDFYYPFRNNFIKLLGNWLTRPSNMVYFLRTVGYYTFDDADATPCPYKLLIGSEKKSTLKDVSSDEDMKEFLFNEKSTNLSNIKFNYKAGQQSFNITLKYKIGNYSVDVPITARTRASGGWSGKALYITSPGIKLVQ